MSASIDMAVAVNSFAQVECEILTDFSQLEQYASGWQKLWAGSKTSEVFQHFGWARAYWKAYGDELALLTPVVHRGHELIGVLPLAVKKGTLQFLGSPFSDYNDVICADEDVNEVMDAAVQSLLRRTAFWKTCVMENVPARSRIMRYLASQPATARHFHTAFRSPCPTVILGDDGTLATKLAGKQSLRRHENHLRKQGRVTFKHLEQRDQIDEHLESMFQQHIARRAIAGESSHFLDPRARRLFQELAHELDPRGALRFSVLSLDDKPVAYHFGFESQQKIIIYQLSFDVDYWKSSPGEVLFRNLLFYARDNHVQEFDFTRGGEGYKDRFANEVRTLLNVYFDHDFGFSRRAQIAVKRIDGAARQFMETLRKHPPSYRFARLAALRCRSAWRTWSEARQEEGRSLVNGAIRSLIFDRKVVSTFVVSKQNLAGYKAVADPEMEISPLVLSELAVISATKPELGLSLTELHERIMNGQQLHLVRKGTEPYQIWSMTVKADKDDKQPADSKETALVFEQCWTSRCFSCIGVFDALLRVSGQDKNIIISCDDRDQVATDMRLAGLSATSRTVNLRVLHWFRPVLHSQRPS